MTKIKVSNIIKEGKSSQEIRREVIGFPYKPSKGYFRKIGCKNEEAEKYESILQKRDSMCSEERFEFIASQNVDLNNLIIDTCIFGQNKTIELMENADNVIILLAILNEMDKKKDVNQEDSYARKMAERIRWYTNLFLIDKEKYHLIPFAGYKKDMYPDDVIIQYLLMTEATKRPTILTVDTVLANKADSLGLEYILYKPVEFVIKRDSVDKEETTSIKQDKEKAKSTTSTTEKKKKAKTTTSVPEDKKQVVAKKEKNPNTKKKDDVTYSRGGVEIYVESSKVLVKKYNGNAKIFYFKEGEYKELDQEEQLEQPIEFTIVVPILKRGTIYIEKVSVKKGEIHKFSKEYFGLNEIYIDEWIDEKIKNEITDIIY